MVEITTDAVGNHSMLNGICENLADISRIAVQYEVQDAVYEAGKAISTSEPLEIEITWSCG